MLFQLPTSAFLLALVVLTEASSHGHGAHLANMRRRQLNPRGPQPAPAVPKASLGRRSCRKKGSSSSVPASSSTPAVGNVGQDPSPTTKKEATHTTSSTKATAAPPSSGGVAAGNFKATKPANWPTATQSGPKPTSTAASASDPYLEELSKAIDNSGNSAFTSVHKGQMTYYGQGLGACGDVYDDNSFTAAVSQLMFDTWPGASAEQNRNPICGPFVPGRKSLNSAGLMVSSVKSSLAGYAEIGGDGFINCVGSSNPIVQCHIPLTATVTHGGKSIQVKIVDRCVGCKYDDIDLTPAAFAALADPALGRTDVTWKFDNW
jgi:rare lipoprotein A (peptidoglycan hydrolase)